MTNTHLMSSKELKRTYGYGRSGSNIAYQKNKNLNGWSNNKGYYNHGGLGRSGYRGKYCLLYTSPSPRDGVLSRMPSSA